MADILKNSVRKACAHNKHAATYPIANTAVNTSTTTTTTTSLAAATDNPATSSALMEEDMNMVSCTNVFCTPGSLIQTSIDEIAGCLIER
jgi:hypothetical protein